MARYVRLGELHLGIEGAALLRAVLDGPDDFVAARIESMRRILDAGEDGALGLGTEVPELAVGPGYAAWAAIYDVMPNGLIEAEQPVVHAALAAVPPGDALDAACGTGRHAAALVAMGHRTVGVDQSEEMLAVAREKVPGAEFRTSDLAALPFEDASFDVAVSSLAITHLSDPAPAIAELARVVRPGGTVVISDAHPTFVTILGQGLFPVDGGFAFVRNHCHPVGRYLAAFAAAGLAVSACEEPATELSPQGLMADVAEAAERLWQDKPLAIVWTLRR